MRGEGGWERVRGVRGERRKSEGEKGGWERVRGERGKSEGGGGDGKE